MEPSRKEQVFIVSTVAVLLLGGIAFGVAQFFWMGPPPPLPPVTISSSPVGRSGFVSSPISVAQPVIINGDALNTFNKTYTLADSEFVKRIPKPFIPERDLYVRSQGSPSTITPTFIVWRWSGTQVSLGTRGPSTTSNYRLQLSTVMTIVAGLAAQQYEIPTEFMSLDFTGDWIVRQTATEEQKMQALGPIISTVSGKKVHFNKQQVDRDIVTVGGQYAFKAIEDSPDAASVHVFIDKTDFAGAANSPATTNRMPVSEFVRYIGSLANVQVTSEVQGDANAAVPFRIYSQSISNFRQLSGSQREEALKKLLDNLSQQTGLTFTRQTKKVDAWALVPD